MAAFDRVAALFRHAVEKWPDSISTMFCWHIGVSRAGVAPGSRMSAGVGVGCMIRPRASIYVVVIVRRIPPLTHCTHEMGDAPQSDHKHSLTRKPFERPSRPVEVEHRATRKRPPGFEKRAAVSGPRSAPAAPGFDLEPGMGVPHRGFATSELEIYVWRSREAIGRHLATPGAPSRPDGRSRRPDDVRSRSPVVGKGLSLTNK